MNSKLAIFYNFNSSPKALKGAFPQILVEDIKIPPIPNTCKRNRIDIMEVVDKILADYKLE